MEEVPPVEDMEEDVPYKCPVLKVFREIKGRRAALLKALTTDLEVLYHQCDPEKANLCLYGYPDGEWRVALPPAAVPSDLPEPVLGINFMRDEITKDEWLSLVAAQSNAWLLSVAFYLGARAGFDKADRNRIFNLINNLPTLVEVVIGESSVSNKFFPTYPQRSMEEDEDEDKEDVVDGEFDESGEILCQACSYTSPSDDFWICCDSCEKWFHGDCVKLTPGMPDHIKYYECASCSNKNAPLP